MEMKWIHEESRSGRADVSVSSCRCQIKRQKIVTQGAQDYPYPDIDMRYIANDILLTVQDRKRGDTLGVHQQESLPEWLVSAV